MKKIIAFFTISTLTASYVLADSTELEARISSLEKEIKTLKSQLAPVLQKVNQEKLLSNQRVKARKRILLDRSKFSQKQLMDIETLYRGIRKNWRKPLAKANTLKILEKYPDSNRAGCALLYLARMSRGEEREKLLKKVISKHADCYYGDGTNVGVFAKMCLAYHYKKNNQPQKADKLFKEILKKHPNAVGHNGKLLSKSIPQRKATAK